jgi:peptide/nickel transport system permease protein
MGRYLLRRVLGGVVTLILVTVAVFFVFQVMGDPARLALPINASDQQVQEYRAATGLADPLAERLFRYLGGAAHLDFGMSTTRGESALDVVLHALPASLWLALVAFIIMVGVGMTVGTIAGLRAGGRVDGALSAVASVLSAIPEFWAGLVLVLVFAIAIPLLPTSGYGGLDYVLLPAIAMAIPPIGRLASVVRESVRSTNEEPFVLVARSKGLRHTTLVGWHILRAALVPILALGGLELSRMAIGGVVAVESIFAWPGIGRLYVDAMTRYDLALVSATLFVATVVILVINIGIDVIYASLDPRITLVTSESGRG